MRFSSSISQSEHTRRAFSHCFPFDVCLFTFETVFIDCTFTEIIFQAVFQFIDDYESQLILKQKISRYEDEWKQNFEVLLSLPQNFEDSRLIKLKAILRFSFSFISIIVCQSLSLGQITFFLTFPCSHCCK